MLDPRRTQTYINGLRGSRVQKEKKKRKTTTLFEISRSHSRSLSLWNITNESDFVNSLYLFVYTFY